MWRGNWRYVPWLFLLLNVAAFLALALTFTKCAHADDVYELLAVHENDFLSYRLPDLVFLVRDDGSFAFTPSPNTALPVNLGIPTRPFRNGFFQNRVSAASFVAAGAPGISTVIHFGQCVLTVQGGLIVSAVVPPGNQPCP